MPDTVEAWTPTESFFTNAIAALNDGHVAEPEPQGALDDAPPASGSGGPDTGAVRETADDHVESESDDKGRAPATPAPNPAEGVKTGDVPDEEGGEGIGPVPYDRFKQANEKAKELQAQLDALKPLAEQLERNGVPLNEIQARLQQEQSEARDLQARTADEQLRQAEYDKAWMQVRESIVSPRITADMTLEGLDPFNADNAEFQTRVHEAMSEGPNVSTVHMRADAAVQSRMYEQIRSENTRRQMMSDAEQSVATATAEYPDANPVVMRKLVENGAPPDAVRAIAADTHAHTRAAIDAALAPVQSELTSLKASREADINAAREAGKEAALAEINAGRNAPRPQGHANSPANAPAEWKSKGFSPFFMGEN